MARSAEAVAEDLGAGRVRGFDMVFDSACRIRSLVTPQTYLLVSRAELTLCRSGEGQVQAERPEPRSARWRKGHGLLR